MRKLHCLLVGVLLLIGEGLLAQTMEVAGTNLDPAGTPISNASIRIKSGKTAASTSADGAGAITIPCGQRLSGRWSSSRCNHMRSEGRLL